MSDAAFAAPCPICGQPIPERPRGSRHGHPPKTCSEACRKERRRRIERERYHAVKHTEQWKSTRNAYLQKLDAKIESNAEFAAMFRARAALHRRNWYRNLLREDPARYEQLKAMKREERAAWRESLMSDPAALEAHRARQREWYKSLSEEDRARIFSRPRKPET